MWCTVLHARHHPLYHVSFFCILCLVGLYVTITIHLSLLLEKRCADVLQPDITWVGGITEARRIVALASAFDVPVRAVPHSLSPFDEWVVCLCLCASACVPPPRTLPLPLPLPGVVQLVWYCNCFALPGPPPPVVVCCPLQVIPHGSSVFSYHLQYAFPSCPMAEVCMCVCVASGEPRCARGYADMGVCCCSAVSRVLLLFTLSFLPGPVLGGAVPHPEPWR